MRSALPFLVCLLALAACHPAFAWPSKGMTGMVIVPAGWFLMGKDDARRSNRPEHWVYLDAFAIDRTEVTRRGYREFLEQAGSVVQATAGTAQASVSDDLPAAEITLQNAAAYCRWAGKRLPSEAEWEKAARGVDGRRYPWGDNWSADLANMAASGQGTVVRVGHYPDGASP